MKFLDLILRSFQWFQCPWTKKAFVFLGLLTIFMFFKFYSMVISNSWTLRQVLPFALEYNHSLYNLTMSTSKLDTSELSGNGVERLESMTPLVGVIWPRLVNETEDRIESQINYIEEYKSVKNTTELPIKTILRVGNFNFENWINGQVYFERDKCPIDQCYLSDDSALSDTADALLISEFDWSSRSKYLPKPPHQIWIAQHWESPKHNRINPDSVRDLINWTASYRRDSTVPFSYGQFKRVKRKSNETGETTNYARGKSKLVAWFVSNCRPSNNRLGYYKELRKHIQVDVYGECGEMKCSRDFNNCSVLLQRDYKFYLAFENSNCKDYITEKLTSNAFKWANHSLLTWDSTFPVIYYQHFEWHGTIFHLLNAWCPM